MKIFRWSGLLGFLAVTALLLVLGFFFIDNWVRAGLEAGGTRVNGAEVNVGSVDLTLSPLGFDIRDIRITNASRPTHNLFELDEVRLELRLAQLFFGRVDIEDLTVDGMRAGTERPRPGRVLERPASDEPSAGQRAREAAGDRLAAARNELPDADSAARQALERTRTAAETADSTMDQALTRAREALDDLPDEAALADYDTRLDRLSGRDLDSLNAVRAARDDLRALGEEVASDQARVAEARSAAGGAVETAESALERVLAAPAEDWAALRDAYPLTQATALRAGRWLLGDAVNERVEQITTWYRQVSPWLSRLAPASEDEPAGPARLDGRYVRFEHPDPSPDFLLRAGRVGFEADGWPWTLTLTDVTGQQSITGRPVGLRLARGEAGDEALLIDGELDRREAAHRDHFELTGRDLGLTERSIEVAGATLDWEPGRADLGGTVTVTGEELDGRLALTFAGTAFAATGDGRAGTLLNQALSDVDAFELGVRVGGRVDNPSIELVSDLDNRLSDALAGVLRAEYDRWLAEARASLEAEVAELRAPLDADLARVREQRDAVQARADAFQQQVVARLDEMRADLEAERERIERRLENEAEDAIRDRLGL